MHQAPPAGFVGWRLQAISPSLLQAPQMQHDPTVILSPPRFTGHMGITNLSRDVFGWRWKSPELELRPGSCGH